MADFADFLNFPPKNQMQTHFWERRAWSTNNPAMKKVLLIALAFQYALPSFPQEKNEYGLTVIADFASYQAIIIRDSSLELVNLKTYIPGISLDIRYATDNNFLREKVYAVPAAFLKKQAAEALRNVQTELKKEHLGLVIYDAYRPYSITKLFYDKVHDTLFVAAPWKGSNHNRGCAVDLSLIDLSTGHLMKMPTDFDDFTEKAYPDFCKLPEDVLNNRNHLIAIMEKNGFNVYPAEWWHFDFGDCKNSDVLDIPFETLIKEENE
jgi:zinc D-Ala-D-Ala dipeptidase